MASLLPSAVHWSHHLLSRTVQPGDVVIDATAGNGHDTLFLAQLVGPTGRVVAFDVQSEALCATSQRLGSLMERCSLHHASHARMAELCNPQDIGHVAAVLFNLGYLPGAKKSCITLPESTLAALDAAWSLLRAGGALIVVVYPGHPGGDTEAAAVAAHLSALPWSAAEVQHLRHANKLTAGPECWVAMKR